MIYFPNCKINIGLFVTGKRDDGFHNIESVFYPIGLNDALEMRVSKENENSFTISGIGSEKDVAPNENNSVLKAYSLLKKDFPQLPYFNIHLDKGIPCFAGLGGGSADGSFALKLIDFMCELHLSKDRLLHYSSLLGSDNPFFIENTPMFVYGRGEKMKKKDLSLKGYHILLVKPNLNISTAEAYKDVHKTSSPFDLRDLDVKDIKHWKEYVKNDFELHLFEKYPILSQYKQMLYDMGGIYCQMSGSGATIYGIFDFKPDIQKIKTDKQTFIYTEEIVN
ncbi:MAG: 4-(cytidine 5'-diphospho)-2-C-methyl-D-erythritol kinase [Bacteroidales bacterium]|nr:4-(cytidine 5'-diphospho)-2-C-methyl-D-erythritol kinase [Bacteroidales bacterium]